MTAEELAGSEDMGDYFRVPADTRDLNYGKYVDEGGFPTDEVVPYTSANTDRLDVDGTIDKLMTVDYVRHWRGAGGTGH